MTRKPIVSRVGTDAINAHGKGQYMEQSATPKPNEETIKERAAKFDAAHMPTPTPKPRAGEHTKGRWLARHLSIFSVLNPGTEIAETYPVPLAITSAEAEANARRIVACVNYCEGVSMAEIEVAPPHLHLKAMLDLIDKDLAAVVDQRNALCEALASIDQLMMAMPLTSKIEHQVHGIAHRALAKAQPT